MNDNDKAKPTAHKSARPSCQSKCESDVVTSGINLTKEKKSDQMPDAIKEKVINHPCYSNDAHHKYARMHLPVAPACNIQCNYCNRKYDCANESRPGVVSEILTPEQALLKSQAVAKAIPQLSVIGIAGPGDPLANPVRTFTTLELIREAMPDMKLCLSTNGLTLKDHIDDIVRLGIDHVTVTINTLDEVIAAQIYKWIYFNGRRYEGVEAGRILIQRQMEGIEALSRAGILTKVNSVMIPGINDGHLPELSRELRRNKVFLHNIMPLISKPEHGTFYGLVGQREPLPSEIDEVRELAGGSMNQMKHCQQCRADAVGMLEEDRSTEFQIKDIDPEPEDYSQTMASRCRFQSAVASKGASETQPTLIVAVATKNSEQIDLHFGHADCFKLYLVTIDQFHYIGERRIARYCTGKNQEESIDTNESNLDKTIRALHGVDLVLCCRIGTLPEEGLQKAGITPVTDYAYHEIDASLDDIFSNYALLAQTKWAERQQSEILEAV